MSHTALKLDACFELNIYQPRSPRTNKYRTLVEANYKFLDCGDPHLGFARIKCVDCNNEYILTFSCKCRSFCPSCHQRRIVEFGEYLHDEVLAQVPHRQ